MKILFVMDNFYTTNNGTSISAQRFAGELRRRGHEVKALCWDSPKDTMTEPLTDGDFHTAKFHMPIFQPLMDKHDFCFAYNDKEKVHAACDWADIVHIFVPFGISWEAIRYCNKIGKPVTGAFHIQPENMTSSVSMGKVEWFNELFYRTWRRDIYSHLRHIHVPSRFMGEMLAERGYKAKIHPISNGIQDAFMEAGERKKAQVRVRKADDEPYKIMMIGRLSQEKRQDVIINAVKLSKYADRIQLVFAGRGPEYENYVELGKDLKHQPEFIYVGRDELIENLLTTDLYVHASDMESEAISCIEAFATGLVPVIANSHVSATPQFALDGRSLFIPGDPKDLARAIDYWLDHPGERRVMEEKYRLFGRQYSLAASVEQFEQMLNEEMQESHVARPLRRVNRHRIVRSNHSLRRVAALFTLATLLALAVRLSAQERVEMLPFGDFENWTERAIKESKLIGGQTKTLYKIGGTWGSSNAYAKAMGIDKVSVSVSPEKRGNGYCCRMESTLETVSAVGINFKALATGSIYTGKMMDVVGMAQSSDPNSAIDMGVPFTGRPSALILDYKALIQNEKAVFAPAKTQVKEVAGRDAGHITLILQHRWEENGHVYAYRVGTAVKKIDKTTDWQNDFRLPVQYGQTNTALSTNRHKTHNSKGKMVCIEEVDYRADLEPTHIIIQISAGSMAPFTGCPGNTVWCDNIRLAYAK